MYGSDGRWRLAPARKATVFDVTRCHVYPVPSIHHIFTVLELQLRPPTFLWANYYWLAVRTYSLCRFSKVLRVAFSGGQLAELSN